DPSHSRQGPMMMKSHVRCLSGRERIFDDVRAAPRAGEYALHRTVPGQSPGRLTGLLLGQLDAFNRLAATFGADVSARFCSGYVEGLRRVLPPGASIIRLGNRRFIALLPADTIGAIMDAAAQLVEDERAHVKIDEDEFVVDLTLGVAVYPTHAEDAERLVRRAELA